MKGEVMNAETLKKIAEYMGLSPRLTKINSGFVLEAKVGSYGWIDYNPLTNNDQMVEIMERLVREHGKLAFEVLKNENIEIQDYWNEDKSYGEGRIINEAVLNAASELVKDK